MKLDLKGIVKEYAGRAGSQPLRVLDGISLSAEADEFVCLLGPSGCGKSTILKMAAGLDLPTQGEVFIDNSRVGGPRQGCGMVFQDYALFPWLTVEGNIGFGLQLQGLDKRKIQDIVIDFVRRVGLKGFEHSLPAQLSGGMRQRVAIARALALSPRVLLMDEPFGALDSFTRMAMQEELIRLWQTRPFTVLFVTHDIEEAVYLADRIVVMTPRPGRIKTIVQVPIDRPRHRTSADFTAIRNSLLEQYEHDGAFEPSATVNTAAVDA